jgi:hypothetical protein
MDDDVILPATPGRWRDRIRLGALVALVCLWVLPPWAEAQVGDDYVNEVGAVRTGASAALALIALWGLSATSLAARSLRGIRAGAALTDCLIATTVVLLLIVRHPWIPGGEMREAWVPIFGPLALLALLDAAVLRFRENAGFDISIIRAGAAVFAAVALGVDLAWIPAGIALWLAVAPLIFLKTRSPRRARRSLEAFILAAAAVAGFAYWIQKQVVGVHPAVGTELRWPLYLWSVTAALLVTTALDGLTRPDDEVPTAPTP